MYIQKLVRLIAFTILILLLTGPSRIVSSRLTFHSSSKDLQNNAILRNSLAEPPPTLTAKASSAYRNLPLVFEAANAHANSKAKFSSRGMGYHLQLNSTEAVMTFDRSIPLSNRTSTRDRAERDPGTTKGVLRMKLVGANRQAQMIGMDGLSGRSNYFIGKDPINWRVNVPHYAKVKAEEVYPGVDLVYYGNQQQLEYDFILSPGADSQNINLEFDGADHIEVNDGGDLVVHTSGGEFLHRKPVVYQEYGGRKHEVSGHYILKARNRVGFNVARHDPARPLVIDPQLIYSTFLGGSVTETPFDIAVDSLGNMIFTGTTTSPDFPLVNPIQGSIATFFDVFVTKLNAAGTAIIFSTYLGGNAEDAGRGIVVDSTGNIYVSGFAASDDFPTVNAVQPSNRGFYDAFVAKLNPTGSALLFSTYLGGLALDKSTGIALDSLNNIYVSGYAASDDFPTTAGAFQPSTGGFFDAFVTKLNSSGSTILASTYLGGRARDKGKSIAVGPDGSVYVTGLTSSIDDPSTKENEGFPLKNPWQPNYGGSFFDAFVTRLNSDLSELMYSTYLGGGDSFFIVISIDDDNDLDVGDLFDDLPTGIAVDSSGNAVVVGLTANQFFPLVNPLQATFGGEATDAFVTKFNTAGSVVFSTYLGGDDFDLCRGVALDVLGNIYLTGGTFSSDFPVANPLQSSKHGLDDVFLSVLNPSGSSLLFSTYLGGSVGERAKAIAVDNAGNAYLAGISARCDPKEDDCSFGFPLVNPIQSSIRGFWDCFVSKIHVVEIGQCTGLNCPANISKAADSNQCGAVVTYPAPTSVGSCSPTCNPPSGSFFPVGSTTVTCSVQTGPSCTFTITVQDNQPPSIVCPIDITTQPVNPGDLCVAVNYPPPTVSDNCPGATVACAPAANSCFPLGTTTVTCIAADVHGNAATCMFNVNVLDLCLQDDSNASAVASLNSVTGEYRFCCNQTTFTGKGKITVKGSIYTLEHSAPDRRVLIRIDAALHKGSGSIQAPPGAIRCTIIDRDTRNNNCGCK